VTASAPVHTEHTRPAATAPLRKVPVQGRSVARVQRMLDACAAIVDEVGYDRLTTTLLAERAGVAIGSVYQFFPDKRAVVQALAHRNLAAYLERLTGRLAGGVDGWWQAVEVAVDDYIRMHRTVPGFQTLHLSDVLDTSGGTDAAGDRSGDHAVIASQIAGVLIAATDVADLPRLQFTLSVALEAVDAVIKSAFRRDPRGDEEVLAEATALVRGYLRARLARLTDGE
jgi:AcrR family transcriptional regulator